MKILREDTLKKACLMLLLWRGKVELMCILDFGLNCPLSLFHLIPHLRSQFPHLWLTRKSIKFLFIQCDSQKTKEKKDSDIFCMYVMPPDVVWTSFCLYPDKASLDSCEGASCCLGKGYRDFPLHMGTKQQHISQNRKKEEHFGAHPSLYRGLDINTH